MSAADDVAEHIRGSLMDLRRRLDTQTAVEVTRAVMRGAAEALHDLSQHEDAGGPIEPRPQALEPFDSEPSALRRKAH